MDKEKDTYDRAIALAHILHLGQTRKDGTPYVAHPIRVSECVGVELAAAAVLHDVIEDCDATPESLLCVGMPERVVDLVVLLTKKEGQSYEEYLTQVKSDPDAVIIKLQDINDNSRDLEEYRNSTNPSNRRWAEKTEKKYEFAKKFLSE